jgi:hypothetical protein
MIRFVGSDCFVAKLLAMTDYWNKFLTTAKTDKSDNERVAGSLSIFFKDKVVSILNRL